ncbi:MAG: hypothetical protein IT435_19810 [Phycisphaerales bacterium]|nr:hypothetical protein [Phycisphaerales bacterium]
MDTTTIHDPRLDSLLKALFDGHADLAAATGLTHTQLAEMFTDPQTRLRIDSLALLLEQRARMIAAQSILSAIKSLEAVMATPIENPRHAETIRKAATTVIRLHDSLHKQTAPANRKPNTQGAQPSPAPLDASVPGCLDASLLSAIPTTAQPPVSSPASSTRDPADAIPQRPGRRRPAVASLAGSTIALSP